MQATQILLWSFLSSVLAVPAFATPDPVEQLQSFSEFSTIDLPGLHTGAILGESSPLMNFPQGIAAQTCFVVPLPTAEVAHRLLVWDPSPHTTLKALAFGPLSEPCQAADFDKLNLKSNKRSLIWLLDKTRATTGNGSELNLTRAEARQLAECTKANPIPEGMGECWTKLLVERATAFQQRGFTGMPAYESNGETVLPAAQIQGMLAEQPAVVEEFAQLLQQTGVFGTAGTTKLKSFHYWGLYEANRHATLTLGVVYLLPVGDRYQLLDVQYYVSGTYYTFVTLYEVWPTQVGAQPSSLIWRGDFIAAPSLAITKGFDRLAYGAVLVQEVKKAIRAFQEDVKIKR